MAGKKKSNSLRAQKIDKAHHRNEFIARLARFCDDVTDAKTFHLIPSRFVEKMYTLRIHPPRLRAADGEHIEDAMLRDAKALLLILFKHDPVHIGIGKIETMPLYDFYTIGYTLAHYAQHINISDYPDAALVKERLAVLTTKEVEGIQEQCMKLIGQKASLIPVFYSNLDDFLYTMKTEIRIAVDGRPGVIFCMDLYARKTEVQTFRVEGANRPAYRVGLYMANNTENICFAGVKPEQIFMPPGDDLSVYIQSHALERLTERLDCIETGVLHYNIYTSLMALKACKNKKGELLLEFSLFKDKVGYFVALVVEHKILIRTFLFLTNNGTPEGEKLHADTGIMKEDKIFLQIDKLSTFLESDIKNNERLKKLFIKAGCAGLLEMDREVSYKSSKEPMKMVAEYISNYLTKNR